MPRHYAVQNGVNYKKNERNKTDRNIDPNREHFRTCADKVAVLDMNPLSWPLSSRFVHKFVTRRGPCPEVLHLFLEFCHWCGAVFPHWCLVARLGIAPSHSCGGPAGLGGGSARFLSVSLPAC